MLTDDGTFSGSEAAAALGHYIYETNTHKHQVFY
jgi:hypothetical protein